ncbi:MAG: helix-turn-helix transcriptional regulator [Gemmatimonadetes bacterium]|nr:helix-turn-helix transcriptional regulator [Gemmatimonadota bacterium]
MPRPKSTPVALSDLAFHVLLALGEGAAHGYAIGKDIERRSGGRLDPTTGSLYQALRRLHEEGLIEPVDAPAEDTDARRRYFALTRAGRRVAAAEATRLAALVDTARERNLFPRRA